MLDNDLIVILKSKNTLFCACRIVGRPRRPPTKSRPINNRTVRDTASRNRKHTERDMGQAPSGRGGVFSTKTFLQVSNRTESKFNIEVLKEGRNDFESSKPSKVFHGITLEPGISKNGRIEIVMAGVDSNMFEMKFKFPCGDIVHIRSNQREALKRKGPSTVRILNKEGDAQYTVVQVVSMLPNCTSKFYVYRKSYKWERDLTNGIIEHDCRHSAWMKRVANGTRITDLTIPGTHDSGTKNGPRDIVTQAVLGHGVITQDLSIKEQLELGIRFLDIRCNNNSRKFGIQHGPFDIRNTTFDEVLAVCKDFLAMNSSEIILMSVKEEGVARNPGPGGFVGDFRENYANSTYPWYRGTDLPVFGEHSRGRIVLLNRFNPSFTDFGVSLAVEDDNFTAVSQPPGGIHYYIQDCYNLSIRRGDVDYKKKLHQIKTHIDAACSGASQDFYLNFTSCVGPLLNNMAVYAIAEFINPGVEALIVSNNDERRRMGTLVMDFPTWSLINGLVESNFPIN
eukprot:gene32553-39360_t